MRSMLAIAIALVAASASVASANPYLGLGIGTAASPSGDLAMTSSDGNRSGRLLGGMRFGRFSVEGEGSRFGLNRASAAYQGTLLGAALKYSLPMGDSFEVFGRAGLQRTWLSTDVSTRGDLAGNGWLLGVGFEYRFDVAGTGASAFVDYERTGASFTNPADSRMSTDEQVGLWTAGVTVSL